MIAAFMLPFPFRGYRAPYLWVFYRMLHAIDEKMLFVTGRDYVAMPDIWAAQGRWEMQDSAQNRLGYVEPTTATLSQHDYAFIPEDLFEALLTSHAGNPVAAFSQLLRERIPSLEAALSDALENHGDNKIEVVLSWCNCPSLSHAATVLGIPILHMEMGPLRWPLFRPTAYLDFSGVNGNTEAAARYFGSGVYFDRVDARKLWDSFYVGEPLTSPTPQYEAGVVLQVEDDSNLVAFGNGFDNTALLVRTHLRHPDGKVLVRTHPGSLFKLKPDWYQLDDSPDSLGFVGQCRRITTINSSVGLEALLMQVPVELFGDCSYRFITEVDDECERLSRLAFYLFAYLVPQELVYDLDYLRFRLSNPSESDIVRRHLSVWGIRYEDWAASFGVGWS
jgi:hypothetical protein